MPDSKSTDNPNSTPTTPVKPRRPRRPRSTPTAPTAGIAAAGAKRATKPPPRRFVEPPRPPALVDTAGPEPDAPLEDVRLAVGAIGGTHGVEGELRMRLLTDAPDHLRTIKRVFIGDEPAARRLLSIRFHVGVALIRLSGVRTPEEGRELLGQTVRISGKDARPLQAGEFYYYQVIGIAAEDETGQPLGTVTDILETGANDVFIIKSAADGKELLIPNIPSAVLAIDPAARRMVIRPLVYWGDPPKDAGEASSAEAEDAP